MIQSLQSGFEYKLATFVLYVALSFTKGRGVEKHLAGKRLVHDFELYYAISNVHQVILIF